MNYFENGEKKHNIDDNRPVCNRCNEPIIYGQKEYHNQHCKDCGKVFCLIHDCQKQNKDNSKNKNKTRTQTTYYVKLGRCVLEPIQANNAQVYKEKWDRLLLPSVTENVIVDQVLKLLRDNTISEIDVKILKTEE